MSMKSDLRSRMQPSLVSVCLHTGFALLFVDPAAAARGMRSAVVAGEGKPGLLVGGNKHKHNPLVLGSRPRRMSTTHGARKGLEGRDGRGWIMIDTAEVRMECVGMFFRSSFQVEAGNAVCVVMKA